LGLVGLGWQVAGVVWGNAIAMAATGLLYGILAYSLVKSRWGRSWLSADWAYLKGLWREVISFLAYNDLNALLGLIPKQLDVVILGYFRNPIEVGYYKLAKSLSATVGYLVQPLQSVTYPKLAKLWGVGGHRAVSQEVKRLVWKIGVPLGLLALGGITFVPLVLSILVGPYYRPAIVVTQILLSGSAIWLAFFWLRPTYLAIGKIRKWTTISIVVVCLSTVGFLIATPIWGYLGLASCLMIMTFLGHSISVFYLCMEVIKQ
jgi:O-antigen/teichoic acid export membrane protein